MTNYRVKYNKIYIYPQLININVQIYIILFTLISTLYFSFGSEQTELACLLLRSKS